MSYIGRQPTVGNFQICDAISVVNGQAAYTMQVGSVNVLPETANHMIVSLNGVIQKPNSSFTVSGSTITFSSNLATGDVIDFIQILGDVLDLGVPSDATVTNAKISYPLAQSGAVVSSFNRTSSDGNILELQKDGTVVGSIGNKSANIFMTNNSSNNTGFKINPNAITPSTSTGTDRDNAIDLGASGAAYKDLYLGGGLLVGGTGTANKLDDYEEGSWTPANPNISLTEAYGRYTKIGNLVTIRGSVVIPTTSDSNQFTLSGLPFTVSNTDANVQGNISLTTIGTDNAYLVVVKNNTTMRLVNNINQAIANSACSGDFINFSVAYTV